MSPSLYARAHKSLRFSPSGDEEAVVINILIEFKSASSMKSRNWMRVALSMEAVTVTGVAVALSTRVDGAAAVFALVCFFLFPGLMLC